MENGIVSRRGQVRRSAALALASGALLMASCQSPQPARPTASVAERVQAAEKARPMTAEDEARTLAGLQELQASDPMSGANRLDPTGLTSLAAAKRNHAKMQAMQGDIDRLMVAQRNRAIAYCKGRPELRDCVELRKLLGKPSS